MIENKIERITNANFNSIKVRLERGTNSCSDYGNAFQFHKGAIRTFALITKDTSYSISIP